jgi:hypothetical protein
MMAQDTVEAAALKNQISNVEVPLQLHPSLLVLQSLFMWMWAWALGLGA